MNMAAAAQQPASLLACVLGAVELGLVVLDQQRQVLLWNGWMERASGLAAPAVLGQPFFAVFDQLHNKRVELAVTQALRDNFPSVLSQTLHKAPFPLYANGRSGAEPMQQAVAVTPLTLTDGARHCLIQIQDVSMAVGREKLLREQALELRSQTFSDGLTGIANRRHFDVAIDREIRRAKRNGSALSLLMIDIDHFKAYNDHYGHQQGDDCLIRVAGALASMLQRPTDLIARYGGEEFAVILPEIDAAHALQLAEAMRRRVTALAIAHVGSEFSSHVTVSIGVTSQNVAQPVELAALLGTADRALYSAKRRGRDRVVAQALD